MQTAKSNWSSSNGHGSWAQMSWRTQRSAVEALRAGPDAAGQQHAARLVGHQVDHPVGAVQRRRPAAHVEHAIASSGQRQEPLQARGQHGYGSRASTAVWGTPSRRVNSSWASVGSRPLGRRERAGCAGPNGIAYRRETRSTVNPTARSIWR